MKKKKSRTVSQNKQISTKKPTTLSVVTSVSSSRGTHLKHKFAMETFDGSHGYGGIDTFGPILVDLET